MLAMHALGASDDDPVQRRIGEKVGGIDERLRAMARRQHRGAAGVAVADGGEDRVAPLGHDPRMPGANRPGADQPNPGAGLSPWLLPRLEDGLHRRGEVARRRGRHFRPHHGAPAGLGDDVAILGDEAAAHIGAHRNAVTSMPS